jgi:hypothetical protein
MKRLRYRLWQLWHWLFQMPQDDPNMTPEENDLDQLSW